MEREWNGSEPKQNATQRNGTEQNKKVTNTSVAPPVPCYFSFLLISSLYPFPFQYGQYNERRRIKVLRNESIHDSRKGGR